jgi:uncharacterized protein YwgA
MGDWMTADEIARILEDLAGLSGKALDAETFDSRLRIQKSVYLLKALGSATAKKYSFSDYFHGPYAPNLAKEYYALKEAGKLRGASPRARVHNPLDGKLAIVAEAVRRGNPFLEAATTLHSIASLNPDASMAEVHRTFSSVKPRLVSRFEEALGFLKANQLIADRT